MRKLVSHPAAELLPLLSQAGIDALASDIGRNGLLNPITIHEGKILDGRNRLRACHIAGVEPQFVEFKDPGCGPVGFVLSQNVHRRQLTPSQLAVVALDALPFYETAAKQRQGTRTDITQKVAECSGEAREHAAQACGVNRTYVSEVKTIAAKAPELLPAIRSGEKTITEAKRELSKREREARKLAVPADLPAATDRFRLHHGDIANAVDFIAPGSIDAIITDPPYGRNFLPLYEQLAKAAAHGLRDGGSLIVLCGQVMIPEVLAAMTPYINYHWMLSYDTPGGNSLMYQLKITNQWKPVLWFVKGKYVGDTVSDRVISERAEKDLHGWQQSESGIWQLVNRFSDPGQTILDPFMGSGTTGLAAVKANRLFIGIEIDEVTHATALHRLSELGDTDKAHGSEPSLVQPVTNPAQPNQNAAG